MRKLMVCILLGVLVYECAASDKGKTQQQGGSRVTEGVPVVVGLHKSAGLESRIVFAYEGEQIRQPTKLDELGKLVTQSHNVHSIKLNILPGIDAQKTWIVIPYTAVRTEKEKLLMASPDINAVSLWMGPGGAPDGQKGHDGSTKQLVELVLGEENKKSLYGKFAWTPKTGELKFHGTIPDIPGKLPLNVAFKFQYAGIDGGVTLYDQAYRLFHLIKHPETGELSFSMNSRELHLERQGQGPASVPQR